MKMEVSCENVEHIEVKCEVIEISDGSDDEDAPKPRRTQCPFCAKMFTKTSNFKVHMRTHGEGTPKNFQCNVCAKMFHSNFLLKRHLNSHLGEDRERKHSCAECGKAYTQFAHLREHELKKHGKGEKRFTCSECSAGFYRKSDHDRHFRIHTGEKRFICQICSRAFAQKCNLNVHIKGHIGDKKFECTECDKKYVYNASLMKHYKRHEKKKMKQKMKQEREREFVVVKKMKKQKVIERYNSSSE